MILLWILDDFVFSCASTYKSFRSISSWVLDFFSTESILVRTCIHKSCLGLILEKVSTPSLARCPSSSPLNIYTFLGLFLFCFFIAHIAIFCFLSSPMISWLLGYFSKTISSVDFLHYSSLSNLFYYIKDILWVLWATFFLVDRLLSLHSNPWVTHMNERLYLGTNYSTEYKQNLPTNQIFC